ncbi:MAG: DUF559 domain-containing protein [bacterium]
MCENHIHINEKLDVNAYDPTRTTTLRNSAVRTSNKKFNELSKLIRLAVEEDDVFGLKEPRVFETPGERAFEFKTLPEKIREFMKWLQEQIDRGILSAGILPRAGYTDVDTWMNLYIYDSYKRAVQRARTEMIKAGYDVPTVAAAGGIELITSAPYHVERLGLLYTRAFNELKGVTDAMSQQISRILTEGLADGDNPRVIARKLVAVINGQGIGDLGITDSLGRFIPAKRRAEILARTEIIRAYHQAAMMEYKKWEVEGMEVIAEFLTAGDNRVCPICADLHGQRFEIDEVMDLIPVHPQCFIDPQVPIYTSDGWKGIGDIKIGDYVLTHKHRFKKVYALPRKTKQLPNLVTITLETGKKITMTDGHPVLLITKKGIKRWIKAKNIKKGASLDYLSSRCKRCDKPIPYDRKYCSRTCLSKDITDKQWSDPEHRRNVSRKNKKSMLEQYRTGKRDRFEATKKANDKTRAAVIDGTYGWWMDDAFFKKVKKVTNLPEHLKASSKRMKNNNPMFKPEIREKATMNLIKTLEENPEKRLNARLAKHRKTNKMTWIEKRMSVLLDKIGIDYIFQYPILKYDVDFAIPSLRIVIECDGEYWHQDKEKDRIRQERIEKEGWFVLRFTGRTINQCLDEVENKILRVVGNHTGSYETLGIKVKEVKKWIPKKSKTLYNLSVEEDESYIVKGVVVHNCRCVAVPIVKGTLNE